MTPQMFLLIASFVIVVMLFALPAYSEWKRRKSKDKIPPDWL